MPIFKQYVKINNMRKIVFCSHAEEKFLILKKHRFQVTKKQVIDVLRKPDKIEAGYGGRHIAQKKISEGHVLRVVFEKAGKLETVVTFYPGRREYYES